MSIYKRARPNAALQSAATANQLAGSACILIGLLTGCMTISVANGYTVELWMAIGMVCLVFFVPGALYLGFAPSLRAGRMWAAVTSMIIASLQAIFWGLIFVVSFIGLKDLITAVLSGCILAASIAVIWNCSKSFSAIRTVNAPKGFEVISIPAPLPVESITEALDPQLYDASIEESLTNPPHLNSEDWPEIR